MDSFGAHLRKARENKDISLEEVSRATRISISVLQALENEHYDVLPPKVYVRGFVRSYCRYVGLDEAELLRSYEEAAAEKRTAASRAREQGTKKSARTRLLLLLVLFAALLALLIHDSFLGAGTPRAGMTDNTSEEDVITAAQAGLEFWKEMYENGNFIPVIADQGRIAAGETPVTMEWNYLALANRDALAGNPELEIVVPQHGVIAGPYCGRHQRLRASPECRQAVVGIRHE